jgi:biotin carboxyl carrier protein
MRDEGLRTLLQTLGSAVLGIGLGLGILAVGFIVSRMTLAEATVVTTGSNAALLAPATSPSLTPRPAATTAPTTAPTAASTPVHAETPIATPAASPTPTATTSLDALTFELYTNGGRHFAAFVLSSAPYTVTSPIAGTVSIAMYQFLDGDVRVGSNIPELPFFPYVTVTGSERKVVLRPSSLQAGVKLLVQSGQKVGVGDALFSIKDLSASSWRTFYDRSLEAPVIASALSTSTGAEVDPLSIFKP